MLKCTNKILFFIPSEIIFFLDLKLSNFFFFGASGWFFQNLFRYYSLLYNKKLSIIRLCFLSSFLLYNCVLGLIKSYFKYIQLRGRSFKFLFFFNSLILKFGFSHKIYYTIPNNVKILLLNKQIFKISGKSLQKIKKIFFDLHSIRNFDKYKGKGLIYYKDTLVLKESSKKTKV